MKADDVRVTLERDNLLAISGERVSKALSDQSASVSFPVREIKYGKFLRTLDVPSGTMVSSSWIWASSLISDPIPPDEYHISGNERWHAPYILASFSSGRQNPFSAVIFRPRCSIMFYLIRSSGLHSQLLHYDLYAMPNL